MTAEARTESETLHAAELDLLNRWPHPNERLTIPTRHGDTFVIACGPVDAPPLVLLHGSGATSAMWLGDVPTWSRHFRVFAVDTIGEPGLSAPSRPPLDSDAHAQWLDDVLHGLGIPRPAIVGTSLGAWLALDYTIRRPRQVDRLVLISPSGVGRQKVGVLLAAILLKPFGAWGLETTLKMVLGAEPAPLMKDYVLLIHRHFRPRRERIPIFSDDALRNLNTPLLTFVGEQDALLDSQETQQRLTRLVPQGTVMMLPGVGHLVPPHTETILEFLTTAPPTTTTPHG